MHSGAIFHPCLLPWELELLDLMVAGQIVFERVAHCVSCKFVSFP